MSKQYSGKNLADLNKSGGYKEIREHFEKIVMNEAIPELMKETIKRREELNIKISQQLEELYKERAILNEFISQQCPHPTESIEISCFSYDDDYDQTEDYFWRGKCLICSEDFGQVHQHFYKSMKVSTKIIPPADKKE